MNFPGLQKIFDQISGDKQTNKPMNYYSQKINKEIDSFSKKNQTQIQ